MYMGYFKKSGIFNADSEALGFSMLEPSFQDHKLILKRLFAVWNHCTPFEGMFLKKSKQSGATYRMA